MNIVITGASRGIGFELAKQFAMLGANNIIAIARDEAKLKELKSACIRENIEAHLYPLAFDITNLGVKRLLIYGGKHIIIRQIKDNGKRK